MSYKNSKTQEDHHKVKCGNHTERAKHINAKPYKKEKYKKNYVEDIENF